LKCIHCYETGEKCTELSTREAKSFIREFSITVDLWNKVLPLDGALHLTGGEPFLRDDLFELIDYARNLGLIIRILTNGTLITSQISDRLKNAGIKNMQISIDGISDTHDLIRGSKGSFKKAMNSVDLLTNNGIYTNIACTVSKMNLKDVPKLVDLALNHKVKAIRFARFVPLGQGNKIQDFALSPEETQCLFQYINYKKKELSGKLEILDQDPLFCLFDSKSEAEQGIRSSLAMGRCSIGFQGVCVLPNGTVYPCRKLPIPIGNIRDQRFRDIWLNSKILNNIRNVNKLEGKCGICDYKYECKGCRAVAFALTGNYMGPDLQCWHDLRGS
jgi:AdoMet-dependent heme synthase